MEPNQVEQQPTSGGDSTNKVILVILALSVITNLVLALVLVIEKPTATVAPDEDKPQAHQGSQDIPSDNTEPQQKDTETEINKPSKEEDAGDPGITILSPEEGAEYCLGDIIPISYLAPKSVKLVSLSTTWSLIGDFRTIQDQEGEFSLNTLQWDQTYDGGGTHPENFAEQLWISGRSSENSSARYSARSPYFAVIDCNY